MQEIQPKQRTFISRIESVTDTDVNNALFTLYGNLVEPLANIENMIATISVARKTQEECGTVISYSRPQTAFNALKKVPRNFIIFSIFMIIIYSTLGNWILNNFNTPKILDLIIDPPMTQAFVVFFIISTVLTFAMEFLNTSYNVGEQNKTRKEEYDKATNIIAQWEPELKQQVHRIQETIQFVPPKYRFSAALSYFVEAYRNSQVDNLKEAVNAYETYYFRQLALETQQQLLEQERKNGELLSGIYFEQLVTMQQLDSIRGDIWLSSAF